MSDIMEMPAVEMRDRIARRDISPKEILAATHSRIDRLNPHLNAFVEMSWERAEREAEAAERRVMQAGELPPLLGLPIGVKESTDVEGLHTTQGSHLYADDLKAKDARCQPP